MTSFAKYAYTSDDGLKHPLRMSNNDATAQTTAASTTGFTSPISAKRSLTSKKVGLKPRYLRLSRSVTGGTGGGAVTKVYYDTLPVLLPADFTAFAVGGTVTINGVTWNIIGKVAEHTS